MSRVPGSDISHQDALDVVFAGILERGDWSSIGSFDYDLAEA
jgi:hypothetical protein